MKILFYLMYFSFFVINNFSQLNLASEYFPDNIGNKWVYNFKGYDPNEPPFFYYDTVFIEVVGDTTFTNLKSYKIFRENNLYDFYYRVDTNNNFVYEFNTADSSESIFLNFNLSPSDSVLYSDSIAISYFSQDSITFLNKNYQPYVYEFSSGSIGFYKSYLKGIGLYSEKTGSLSFTEKVLKGSVINNMLLGDTLITNVRLNNQLTNNFELKQNYPNPFNPETKILFVIPKASHVKLIIFNSIGESVKTLVNEFKNMGSYEINFDGSNLSSGVYFYRLILDKKVITKKLVLLK